MNILYGVVGEGMGHATRSEAIIRHLLGQGHRVLIVASGKAEPYLRGALAGHANAAVDEIGGTFIKYAENRVRLWETVASLMKALPTAAVMNAREIMKLNALEKVPGEAIQAVVTDFESLAHAFGKMKGLPIINIDNQGIITRCDHSALAIPKTYGFDRFVTDMVVRFKVIDCDAYLVTTFFFPPVKPSCRENTFLFTPILRPEIYRAGQSLESGETKTGEHVLVYQTSESFLALLDILNGLDRKVIVYGFDPERYQSRFPRLELKGRDREGFFRDLATARAVVTGGGFSLMSEAVHLGKPILSIPIEGQFEQILNALYLEHLGYGVHADSRLLKGDPAGFRAKLDSFFERECEFRESLARYRVEHGRTDNAAILAKVDECLGRLAG